MSKKVSVSVLVFSIIAAMLISFMSAYAICNAMFNDAVIALSQGTKAGSGNDDFDTILNIIKENELFEFGDDVDYTGFAAWLGGEIGDDYLIYYTPEEFEALYADNEGKNSASLGISIIKSEDGNALEVVSVNLNSPAYHAGVQEGDLIVEVIEDGVRSTVEALGYEETVSRLQGEAGTSANFTVLRDGNRVEFSIIRQEYESPSVLYHVNTLHPEVGVVKILQFNLTTPPQFKEAMDSLIAAGCEYFVFDVRSNPGGDLNSVSAVLSYMLNEGDTIIRIAKRGEDPKVYRTVTEVNYGTGTYATCSVAKNEISKYRSAVEGKCVVLTDENTASAGELFTATLKDYELVSTAGTVTFGKGIMQQLYTLSGVYGDFSKGGLRVTTEMYYPPLSDYYHGIGLTPDVTVELDESLKNKKVYELTDTEDNQLKTALNMLGIS